MVKNPTLKQISLVLVSYICLFSNSNHKLVSAFAAYRTSLHTHTTSVCCKNGDSRRIIKERFISDAPCLSLPLQSTTSKYSVMHSEVHSTRTLTSLQSIRLPIDAVSSPHTLILSAISAFFKNFPYISAFIACATKASLADYIAQKRFGSSESSTNGKMSYNYARTAAFLLYGGLYQGCVQEHIFNHLFPVWFGAGIDMNTVLKKVVFDMLVLSPFVCLPAAYLAKSVIFRYSVIEAAKRYVHDVMHNGLLKKYVLLWFPVNCLTFSVIPEHFRIAWVAAISFFWMMILSYVSSKNDAYHHGKSESSDVASDDMVIVDDDYEGCVLIDGVTCALDG